VQVRKKPKKIIKSYYCSYKKGPIFDVEFYEDEYGIVDTEMVYYTELWNYPEVILDFYKTKIILSEN
jgi:hypothetical protein